jgi:hypothetical protein
MRSRLLWAFAATVFTALIASAQTTTDPLQALKDTLGGGEQQGSILQDVLGQGSDTTKKSDKKLENPQTVLPPQDQKDIVEKNIKTRDERVLRQFNEDPELRADDSVTIELRSVDDICARYNLGPEALQTAAALSGVPTPSASTGANSNNPLSALASAAGVTGAAGGASQSPLAGLSGANGIGGITGQNANGNNGQNANQYDLTRCPLPTDKLKTEEEKSDSERFQQRILAGNPYKLNRFGVLELPGLPAMPLSGLTAS